MAKIIGTVLRDLRNRMRLTQEGLAEKGKVDVSTIRRIEHEGMRGQNPRASTVLKLARALEVEPATLAGEVPSAVGETEHEPPKDQFNIRIDTAARNALNLVSLRYRVKQTQVIELAPLLFFMAAERSLMDRRSRVEELENLEMEWENNRNQIPHLPAVAVWRDEGLEIEADSVDARDVLGRIVDKAPIHNPNDSQPGLTPLGSWLKASLGELPGSSTFEHWHPDDAPEYRICLDEALTLVGGDETLADAILRGSVPLHSMPKEVRRGSPEGRAAWARGQIEADAKAMEEFLRILEVDLPDQPDAKKEGL